MSAPLSYLAIDPGRKMGWACCLRGGEQLAYGTWKFQQQDHGEAYASFAKQFAAPLTALPDVLVGMEMLTIVAHEGDNGKAHVDGEQVGFSAGWPAIVKTKCFVAGARPPEMIAIMSWRSKTHGKTRAPDSVTAHIRGTDAKAEAMRRAARSNWLKKQAFDYCARNGWKPDSDNAAEALCMLDYLRILHEPDFAFDRGAATEQTRLFA